MIRRPSSTRSHGPGCLLSLTWRYRRPNTLALCFDTRSSPAASVHLARFAGPWTTTRSWPRITVMSPLTRFERTQLSADRMAYVSYRVGDAIYWTKAKVRLPKGETILSDGVMEIRARCGNCIALAPMQPTAEEEPLGMEFDSLITDADPIPSRVPLWGAVFGPLAEINSGLFLSEPPSTDRFFPVPFGFGIPGGDIAGPASEGFLFVPSLDIDFPDELPGESESPSDPVFPRDPAAPGNEDRREVPGSGSKPGTPGENSSPEDPGGTHPPAKDPTQRRRSGAGTGNADASGGWIDVASRLAPARPAGRSDRSGDSVARGTRHTKS